MITFNKTYTWTIIFIIVLSVIFVVFTGSKRGVKNPMFQTVSLGDLIQQINDLRLVRFRGEDVEWEMKAKSAILQNGEDDTEVKEINIFYVSHNGTPIKIAAEKGRYNINKNSFFFNKGEDGVNIKIGQSITIKSGDIAWSGEMREIHSQDKVKIMGEKFILEGEDLIANLDSGVYELNRNVHATMW